MISFVTALAMFAVIPFGDSVTLFGREIKLVIADVDIGILYIFAMGTLGEYGIVLGGWSSGNKYGLLGALRAAAQMISYEVALGLIIIGTIILAGSLRLTEIVEAQRGGWFILYQPFAFVLYVVAGLAEINRTPFDMPESESELACGFNIEYSSMKFALFMIAEYAHLVTVAALTTTLFLGGWLGPVSAGTAVVLHQGAGDGLPLHLDQGHLPADAVRPYHEIRLEVPLPRRDPECGDYRLCCGAQIGMDIGDVMIIPLLKGLQTYLKDVFFPTGYDPIPGREKADIAALAGHALFREEPPGGNGLRGLRLMRRRLSLALHHSGNQGKGRRLPLSRLTTKSTPCGAYSAVSARRPVR